MLTSALTMMQRDMDALARTQFDLAVIGGGVHGAAIARQAALCGWKVALVEARDFASGTSSRSSKLIHGGLRYLAQGDFRLVREARRERRLLVKLAPHLVHPLPFLLPIYRGDPYSPLKIRLGLSLYDWLGNLGPQDRHHLYNPRETLKYVPALRSEGLRAGAVYYDSETDDARLSFENAMDAAELGAVVANYAELRAFSRGGKQNQLASAEVEDRLTGRKYSLAARFWVNAAGPWVDRVRSRVPGYDGSETIRMTKGVHLILPCVSTPYALFAAVQPGDRIFLAMPWHNCWLLGTTDTDYNGDPERVTAERPDTDYLLNAVNRVLSEPLKETDVIGSFAGLRALAVEKGRSPSANTREYRFHRDPWVANMLTLCGGKLTTARALAEKLAESIAPQLPSPAVGRSRARLSRSRPLPGGNTGSYQDFLRHAVEAATDEFGVSREAALRIAHTYGSRWKKVLEPVRSHQFMSEPLPGGAGILACEVYYGIREEMAGMPDDFLLRRSGLSWTALRYPELASRTSEIFAAELGRALPDGLPAQGEAFLGTP